MNKLFICSFRTKRKGKPIKLECLDSIYFVSIEYIYKEVRISGEKLFPGDDRDISIEIVTKLFKAKVQSETQIRKIRETISMDDPVIEITYTDSGHHYKNSRFHYILESIESREKCFKLKAIEKELNDKLDQKEKEQREEIDDMNFLEDYINGV